MSTPQVSIYFDYEHGLLSSQFGAAPHQIMRAQGRAVKKLAAWVQTQIAREAGSKTKVPQKVLKPRFYRSMKGGSNPEARIWIGINPVKARRLGRVSQSGRGAKAGRRFFRKSFAANVYGDDQQVWIRKGAARLPIAEVGVSIAEGFEDVLDKYQDVAARKFEEFFEHELKFEMGWFN